MQTAILTFVFLIVHWQMNICLMELEFAQVFVLLDNLWRTLLSVARQCALLGLLSQQLVIV